MAEDAVVIARQIFVAQVSWGKSGWPEASAGYLHSICGKTWHSVAVSLMSASYCCGVKSYCCQLLPVDFAADDFVARGVAVDPWCAGRRRQSVWELSALSGRWCVGTIG